MTNTANTETTPIQHFITETPADWTRYNGRCACGATFSTNSKSGYTTSTRAHLRAERKRRDQPTHDGDIVLDRTACPTAAEVATWTAR